jgi:hypothetical protein
MRFLFLLFIAFTGTAIIASAQLNLPVKILQGNCIHTIIAHNDTLWGVQSATGLHEQYGYSADRGRTWTMVGWGGDVGFIGKTRSGTDTFYYVDHRITSLVFHNDELYYATNMIGSPMDTVYDSGGLYGRTSGHVAITYGNIYSLQWQDSILLFQHQVDDVASTRLRYSANNGKSWTNPPGLKIEYHETSGATFMGDITFYFAKRFQNEYNVVLAVQGDSMITLPTNKSGWREDYGHAFTSYKSHLLLVLNDSLFTSSDSAKTWYHIPTPKGFSPHTVAVIGDTLYVAPPRASWDTPCTVVGVEEEVRHEPQQQQTITYNQSSLILRGFSDTERAVRTVEVVDVLGRSVYHTQDSREFYSTLYIPMETGRLSPGLYNVILQLENGRRMCVAFVKY